MTSDRQQRIVSAWEDLLDRNDVLILDTETTGVDRKAEIVQFSAIRTTGDVALDAFILPAGEVPESACKIHGLSRRRLLEMDARPWPEHYDAYCECIESVTEVLVYNLDYDERLIRQTNERYGLGQRKLPGRCVMKDYAAYRGVEGYYGDWKWHGLAAASRHENSEIVQGSVHSALEDCRAVLGLMRAVCAKHV
ncbi:MAG: 3'-5' exonuclease [Rhodobacteraceae bacterium]|nr:3'-5' exonuclease [Paracoccaceae bacterium]